MNWKSSQSNPARGGEAAYVTVSGQPFPKHVLWCSLLRIPPASRVWEQQQAHPSRLPREAYTWPSREGWQFLMLCSQSFLFYYSCQLWNPVNISFGSISNQSKIHSANIYWSPTTFYTGSTYPGFKSMGKTQLWTSRDSHPKREKRTHYCCKGCLQVFEKVSEKDMFGGLICHCSMSTYSVPAWC